MSTLRTIHFASAVFATLMGCGDDPPPPPPAPEPAPTPVATTAAPADSTPAPSASASAAPSAPVPVGSVEAISKEPRKWLDFAGPEVPLTAKPGERVWAVVPVSVGWETLKLTTFPIARVEGSQAVFVAGEGAEKVEVFAPGAFVAPAQPAAALVENDPVAVAVHGSRSYGRVLSTKDTKVRVRYRFAGSIEESEVETIDTIELDGTMRFGAPVAYSESKEGAKSERKIVWRPGVFVQGSEEKAWLVTAIGKPLRVPLSTVRALGVQVAHKSGDKVWIAQGDEFAPGQITEVVDDGLRYRVKPDATEETVIGLEGVTPPLR